MRTRSLEHLRPLLAPMRKKSLVLLPCLYCPFEPEPVPVPVCACARQPVNAELAADDGTRGACEAGEKRSYLNLQKDASTMNRGSARDPLWAKICGQ